MTKLEEEMVRAVWATRFSSDPSAGGKAAAEVAKKYIEKAFKDAIHHFFDGDGHVTIYGRLNDWLKENGITSDNSVDTIDPPY
jgi:hypothetical protein